MTCWILVPQPGIEPAPSAVKMQSPDHWTARGSPPLLFLTTTWPTVCEASFYRLYDDQLIISLNPYNNLLK